MNTFRFTALVLCLLVASASGCRKGDSGTSVPQTEPGGPVGQSADGRPTPGGERDKVKPKPELDVAQLLQKGGKHWSSLETFAMAGDEIKAGEGFWVRPDEDQVWSKKGESLDIKLRWKRRLDRGAASKDNPVGAEIAGASPGLAFRSYSPLSGFVATADEGVAEANFLFQYTGEGDVVVYLVANGKRPASNLLRLKAKSTP